MLPTPVLDVAIGLSLFYLLLGLICTTVNEMIAGWRKSRANFLDQGIGRLLGNDAKLKEELYKHPLIRSLAQTDDTKSRSYIPSYIPADKFATALLAVVADRKKASKDVNAVSNAAPTGSQAIEKTLDALRGHSPDEPVALSAKEAATTLQTNVEAWFNDGMDRVSGWYKRNAQRNAMILACLITLFVNADTLNAVHILWTNPVARAEAVAIADKKVKEPPPSVEYENPNDATASALKKTPVSPEEGLSEDQKKLLGELTGWKNDCDKLTREGWGALLEIVGGHLLGWIITALAVSMGAPFWFDTLNRFMNIRNAGRATDERRDKSSSAPPVPPAPAPANT